MFLWELCLGMYLETVRDVLEYLGTHVVGRPDESVCHLVLTQLPRDPQVAHFHQFRSGQKNILRFQVAM